MSISREFGRIGHERGQGAEQVMANIIKDAIEQNACPDWIKEYSTASPGEDEKGIDAWVTTDIGKISLQIKSSRKGVQNAKDKYPRIPVTRVVLGENKEKTLSRCINVIGQRRREILVRRGQ